MTNYTNQAAVAEIVRRCNGEHNAYCAWNQTMAIEENAVESGFPIPGTADMVEQAVEMINASCCCHHA